MKRDGTRLKCSNCNWHGTDYDIQNDYGAFFHCPVCNDNTVINMDSIVNDNDGTEIIEDRAALKVEARPSIIARVKDTVEDLLDDGKRNYSNRKKKKTTRRKR